MSSTDAKPTYTRSEEISIVAIAVCCSRRDLALELLKLVNVEGTRLDVLDAHEDIKRGVLADDVDEVRYQEGELSEIQELAAASQESKTVRAREDHVNALTEAILEFSRNCDEIYHGSSATYHLVRDVVLPEVNQAHEIPEDIMHALPLAAELLVAAGGALKTEPRFLARAGNNFHAGIARKCVNELIQRKIAEDLSYHTVSRRVRLMYNLILGRGTSKKFREIFTDGVTKDTVLRRLTGAIRRKESYASDIDYMYCGNFRMIKRNRKLYIVSTDNIRRVYQIVHRRAVAICSAQLHEFVSPKGSYVPVTVVKKLAQILIDHTCIHAENDRPMSLVAKCMHQIWSIEFIRAYEDIQPDEYKSNYESKCEAIMVAAKESSSAARSISDAVKDLPSNIKLDALRMHHMLAAVDTPPETLSKLTASIQDPPIPPKKGFYRKFIEFTKSYILCAYLAKKKEWPNVKGNLDRVDRRYYKMCMKGNFMVPPEEDWGELWIDDQFPYIEYMNQLPLRAKDATRLPDDDVACRSSRLYYESWEHNELLHCIKRGSNLGMPNNLTMAEARKQYWERTEGAHNLVMVAAKAEVVKADIKPRGTFSATGEFRHPQAEFDRNCQVINDIIGCGSLRADPVSHSAGVAKVARGTAQNYTTSSHDVESWSGSQDRDLWCEYANVYIRAFKGLSTEAFRKSWYCFDAVVNKNAHVSSVHLTNGGFQGFPPTLDTSHHVMVLVYFLHRMREKGKIPKSVPTLAKATIDDCIAQMATWNGEMEELEDELAEHYDAMGYGIDKVKSVISRCKAIYLNQAMIRGAFVHQGLKVILKTDRPLEVVLKTPIDDLAACMSGAKASIQAGNDPLVSYFLCSLLGISYLIRNSPRIAELRPQAWVVAALLPRGDGGLGLPTLADIVCKEHPDPRCQANYALNMYFRCLAVREVDVDHRALKLWTYLKSLPMSVVSKTRIFFNPRAITREGVPALEAIKRSAVIEAAKLWAEADPFKSVLALSHNDALDTVYSSLLAGCEDGVDCSFLETYAAHLPETILDALVGKVTSYKVASTLLGAPEVIATQNQINSRFNALVDLWFSARYQPDQDDELALDSLVSVSGYQRSKMEREEFYSLNGVLISNHSIASPMEVITVVGMKEDDFNTPNISSDVNSLVKWAPDCTTSSHSMRSKNGIYVPLKSANWMVDSLDVHRNLDQVSHKFVEGCAVVEWAKLHGATVQAWEMVYLRRWLGVNDKTTADFVTTALQGSIKRSTAAAGDRTHPLFIGTNIARSVNVNVTALNVLVSDGQYDIDPLSLISASYAIGTFNLGILIDALTSAGRELMDFSWSIGIHPECLEEKMPFMVTSKVNMKALDAIFDMELDDYCYLQCGGGTELQLSEIQDPVRLRQLLYASVSNEQAHDVMGPVTDEVQLAPSYAAPTVAPLGIEFLEGPSTKRTKGLVIQDVFLPAGRQRIIEISTQSARLCGMAAMQDGVAKLGQKKIAKYFVGMTEIFTLDEIKIAADHVARVALKLVEGNLLTSLPFIEAAKGLRSTGCTKFDWYDPSRTSLVDFTEEFVKYAVTNPKTFLEAMRRSIPEYASLGASDYHKMSRSAKVSKNPEKSNIAERVSRLKKKYIARAASYSARIELIKKDRAVKESDKNLSGNKKLSRVAYLSGACNAMSSFEFVEGPKLNLETTAARLLEICNRKITEKGGEVVFSDYMDLFEDGEISMNSLILAQSAISAPWWRPADYCKGVAMALEWAEEDAAVEARETYFVPRTVQVRVRIHKHLIDSTPLEVSKGRYTQASEPKPKGKTMESMFKMPSSRSRKKATEEPAAKEEAPVEKPAPPSKSASSFSLGQKFSMKSLMKGPAKPTEKRDTVGFVNMLEPWEVAVLTTENMVNVPDTFSSNLRMRIVMQPRSVKHEHFAEGELENLKARLVKGLDRNAMRLTRPNPEESKPAETYVE